MALLELKSIADKSRTIYDINGLLHLLRLQPNKYMCWGVTETKTIGNSREDIRAVRLKVNGLLHKGYVFIFLNGKDLFDVYLTDLNHKTTKTINDLYFDQLVDIIDSEIEFKDGISNEEYKKQVFKETIKNL